MIEIEEFLSEAQKSVKPLQPRVVHKATAAYFDSLDDSRFPGQSELDAASLAASSCIKKELFSEEWLSAIQGESFTDDKQLSAVELSFNSVAPLLRVPSPQAISELSPNRMALAALIGAVAGMMLLTPLTRLLLGMRDVGLFVGPPIGAFLLVLGVWYASGSKRYDRQEHEATVRTAIEQWLDGAVLSLVFLCKANVYRDEVQTESGAVLFRVVAGIQSLAQVSEKNLPVAVGELVQEIRNLGFAGTGTQFNSVGQESESPRVVCWSEELRERYDTFGNIEPGDRAIIEREPVIFERIVREKGLARKRREGG